MLSGAQPIGRAPPGRVIVRGMAVTGEADHASGNGALDAALTMLNDALRIIDCNEVPSEIGARLQLVIEELEDHSKASSAISPIAPTIVSFRS
jgi:hypothetical protein